MTKPFLTVLPKAVAHWARAWVGKPGIPHKDVLERLCTDTRMSPVWTSLEARARELPDPDRALVAYAREAWLARNAWEKLDKSTPKQRKEDFEDLIKRAASLRRALIVVQGKRDPTEESAGSIIGEQRGSWSKLDNLLALLRDTLDRRGDLDAQAVILDSELRLRIREAVSERLAGASDQSAPISPAIVDSAGDIIASVLGTLLNDCALDRYFPSLSDVLDTLCQKSIADLAFDTDLAEQLRQRKLNAKGAEKVFCIRLVYYMARDLFDAPLNNCVADTVTTILDLQKPLSESTVRENTAVLRRGILPEISA